LRHLKRVRNNFARSTFGVSADARQDGVRNPLSPCPAGGCVPPPPFFQESYPFSCSTLRLDPTCGRSAPSQTPSFSFSSSLYLFSTALPSSRIATFTFALFSPNYFFFPPLGRVAVYSFSPRLVETVRPSVPGLNKKSNPHPHLVPSTPFSRLCETFKNEIFPFIPILLFVEFWESCLSGLPFSRPTELLFCSLGVQGDLGNGSLFFLYRDSPQAFSQTLLTPLSARLI